MTRVIGYLNLEFEGDAIYLHKEDYEQSIYSNSFWVSFKKQIDTKNYNKQYVLIEGIFNMNNKGHLGLFSGEINEISRVSKWGK